MTKHSLNHRLMITISCAIIALFTAANASDRYTPVEVQLASNDYLKNLHIDGVINFMDFETNRSVKAVVIDNHPMLFEGDGFYISCVTLVDASGKEYPVDMYVYPSENGPTVSHAAFGMASRGRFMELMKSGAVSKLR